MSHLRNLKFIFVRCLSVMVRQRIFLLKSRDMAVNARL